MSRAADGDPKEASAGLKVTTLLWAGGCAAGIILFMAAIAGPKLISARIPGNETAAIGALKSLGSAQALFRVQEGERYGTLEELADAELVDTVLGSGQKQGYRFECGPATDRPSDGWWASAVPLSPGSTGYGCFVITHQGTIYVSDEGPIAVDVATAAVPEGTRLLGQ